MFLSIRPITSALVVSVAASAVACSAASSSDAELAVRDSVRLVELPARLASITTPSASAARDSARAALASRRRTSRLTPLADTISSSLVLMVNGRRSFTASVRAKRLLVDIGRVDTPLKSPERLAAFREAVSALSPLRRGDTLRLHGPWGVDVATIRGFDVWNGRIVATLDANPRLDSLAQARETLVARAARVDTAATTTNGCARDTLSPLMLVRLKQIGDSVEQLFRADTMELPERLRRAIRVQRTHGPGCFGAARAILFVTAQAGSYEWVRQAAVLIEPSGALTPLRVRDPNFQAHELLHALDADGDGVDDIAARGRRHRGGGTTILRLDADGKRLDRLTSGFLWEG